MNFLDIIKMGGGVALFLYGMNVMGAGLEKLAGSGAEKALEKLTNNIFFSVALGALVTAIVQSSSATTVIVVGLVNAGIIQLRQAIGVIMGANIGTTVTAQLIRLADIDGGSIALQFFKPTTLAPLAALIGIVLFMAAKSSKHRDIGQMLLGIGVLFSGMFAMEAAVKPLQSSPIFIEILTALSNPILGVIAGAVITALIQSSSASVGMLQAISSTGVLRFSAAFPIIMGQNIGTCITPILSSIGASKNAKRAALVHLYFNLIGTTVFLIATYSLIAVLGAPASWNETIGRTGIANFHTFFNITVTILFIPFAGLIEKLAYKTIKSDDPGEGEKVLEILDNRLLKSPAIALQQSEHLLVKMSEYAYANYADSIMLLNKFDKRTADRINETEDIIDRIEDQLEHYLIKLSAETISPAESQSVSKSLHIVKDYERISDYCTNLMECAEEMNNNNIEFSLQAQKELDILLGAVNEILIITNESLSTASPLLVVKIEPLEETIDAIVEHLKDTHIERLKGGECNVHGGVVFLEILVNLERIADHCSNIGIAALGESEEKALNPHKFIENVKKGNDAKYIENLEAYMEKYFKPIRNTQP